MRTCATCTRAGGHWIAGERMRDGSPDAQAALSRQGRYQTVRDNLRVKEVRVGDGDAAKRFIVCHNPAEADRDAQPSATTRIAPARRPSSTRIADRSAPRPRAPRPPRGAPRAPSARCATTRRSGATCARPRPAGCCIDRAKIKAEERLDGKYLLSTSDPDLSAEDVALGYKNLLEAERGFRDLKTTLELRPVFHRLEHRIRAHVLLCWLALLLIRVAERQTDQTWRTDRARTRPPAPRHAHRPRPAPSRRPPRSPTPSARSSPRPSIEPPPRITALQPA